MRHYDVDATISHSNENRNILRASSPREVTRERHRMESREQVAGKESESLSFLRPSLLQRSLARLLSTRNGEVSLMQSITFLVSRARSVFGEPVYVGYVWTGKFHLNTDKCGPGNL